MGGNLLPKEPYRRGDKSSEKVAEYERFGGKKMQMGGRMDEEIGWPPF